MTKPVILSPNSQKINKRQTILGFARFCFTIKIFVPMLEKEVLFTKFRVMRLNIPKIHKILEIKLTSNVQILFLLNFIAVSDIEHKYEPFRKISKINLFLKQV